jgi:hypothetical protein
LWGVVAGNWPDLSDLSHRSIHKKLHWSWEGKPLVKLLGYSYNFDIAKSEYDSQTAHLTAMLRVVDEIKKI